MVMPELGQGCENGRSSQSPVGSLQRAARWLNQHLQQAHCATLAAINLQLYFTAVYT